MQGAPLGSLVPNAAGTKPVLYATPWLKPNPVCCGYIAEGGTANHSCGPSRREFEASGSRHSRDDLGSFGGVRGRGYVEGGGVGHGLLLHASKWK